MRSGAMPGTSEYAFGCIFTWKHISFHFRCEGCPARACHAALAFPIVMKQIIHMPKKPKKAITVAADNKPKRNHVKKLPTEIQAIKVATLKDLRKATQHTQDDLAVAMGVGQGTISRIEKRDDMLVSTLQHYVEGVGGRLQILATFPNRPPLVVERLGKKISPSSKDTHKKPASSNSQAGP